MLKLGNMKRQLNFFKNATKGTTFNRFVLVPLLNACASLGALEEVGLLFMSGWDSYVKVGNCFVDMYAKCGSMDDA